MRLRATLGRWLELPIGSSRHTWRRFWNDTALAYLFLLPTLLVLGTFSFYPVFSAFALSLYDWDMISPEKPFVLFDNYKELLTDSHFWRAVYNTAVYVIGTVPTAIAIALGVAVLLNQPIRFRAFYRLAFFVPYVATVVAVSMVWSWLYHDQWGLFNTMLKWFGLPPQQWLLDPEWTMFTIILMAIWKTVGYKVVIFLAGLQTIDQELYNAAKVDGAHGGQIFRHITWPLLTPTTFFISITSIIGAFKVFDHIFVLYGGKPGPMRIATTMVFYVYEKAWGEYRMGYASAAAYVLFFFVLAFTMFQFWYAKKRVHYS